MAAKRAEMIMMKRMIADEFEKEAFLGMLWTWVKSVA